MISLEELKRYASARGLNLGQAEKDYFQNIILFILYQHYGNELVFKGGTALMKCFGSPRFSEDLDFTSLAGFDKSVVERGLRNFGLGFEVREQGFERAVKTVTSVEGPMYDGSRRSRCKIVVDVSLRESVILKPFTCRIGRFMYEIPEFDVMVMDPKEILAEKIRAVVTRKKARDLYDIWFLLERGSSIDPGLVKRKLLYYGVKPSEERILKEMKQIAPVWDKELRYLVKQYPPFKKVYAVVSKQVIETDLGN